MLPANRIEAVLVPASANARRLMKAAKEKKAYLDLTSGRATKALIMMDDGKVVGCALTPRTIAERIQAGNGAVPEGGEENEDHPARLPEVFDDPEAPV